MSKHHLFHIPLLLLSFLGMAANAASFDCKLARNGVEALICTDKAVSKLDEQLDVVYAQVRKTSNNENQEKAMQLAWLKTRNTCEDLACLQRAYELRIAELQVKTGSGSPMSAASGSGVTRTAANPQATEERNKSIKAAIEKLGDPSYQILSYQIGWFDLDGDGTQEAIVLVTGNEWCGTSGCTLMVLKQDAGSWRVVSQTPACRAPVVLLDETTNGWRDLAVISQGGGDLDRKTTVLKVKKHEYVKYRGIAAEHRGQAIIP